MDASPRGLYESLLTQSLNAQLAELGEKYQYDCDVLDSEEAADRLALHLSKLLERALAHLEPSMRVAAGVSLTRRLVAQIIQDTGAGHLADQSPLETGQVLRAIGERLPDGRMEEISSPLLSLLDTTLLTNAPGEPRIGSQIVTEIESADRIELVMAFIRMSGIAPMLEALKKHCAAGRSLSVLTTTYTGSTEADALDALTSVGGKVRVSYDESSTRLHAKAWLFHRSSGFTTAYIGSSNLTHSAQVSGLEWNLRVSNARNSVVINKMTAMFSSYWNGGDFVSYVREEFLQIIQQREVRGDGLMMSPVELRPEPFQVRLLEQLQIARRRGHHRNLLVAATGTGKTVMAALDYAHLCTLLPRTRLLFVVHREEILKQSLATFRHALRDHAFGELWVGGERPRRFEHVFASIQSLSASGIEHIDPDHFDVLVIDEFHHAAAESYKALLEHLHPVEVLGLTATPERADGLSILDYFDGRIAGELRLWDAIDQQRLVPFSYFGIHDGLDLSKIPWRRGRGYDVQGLTNIYTANDAWARLVFKELHKRVPKLKDMRALGFCVSVEHARYMARIAKDLGLAATAVWADTAKAEREQALVDLKQRRLNVIFSVDLFNEGVDVPAVDTLLMLRPTDSGTLFLQQLGRGLRRSPGKTHCTVLDFVGMHRTEFRFDLRLTALLGGNRARLMQQIQQGFPFLPSGCHMELDPVASRVVLDNIRQAIPSRWPEKVAALKEYVRLVPRPTLRGFLWDSGMTLEDLYSGNKSWTDLLEEAGCEHGAAGPKEAVLRRACGRLLHVDDQERIDAYRALLSANKPPRPSSLGERQRRYLRMLVASVVGQAMEQGATIDEACRFLWRHEAVRLELLQLLDVLDDRIDHLGAPLRTHPDVPLVLHARYTRIEILAAFDVGDGAKTALWQSGVYWASEAKADLLAFTKRKSLGRFSPTTMYEDYAISRDLIHWQSQSTTRADSPTGRRYRNHAAYGTSILLFARELVDDRSFYFLGPATYVSHEHELPMSITWRLEHPLPVDLGKVLAVA